MNALTEDVLFQNIIHSTTFYIWCSIILNSVHIWYHESWYTCDWDILCPPSFWVSPPADCWNMSVNWFLPLLSRCTFISSLGAGNNNIRAQNSTSWYYKDVNTGQDTQKLGRSSLFYWGVLISQVLAWASCEFWLFWLPRTFLIVKNFLYKYNLCMLFYAECYLQQLYQYL